MPAELVMLHERAPEPAALYEAFRQVCPEGSAIELRGGQITVLLDDMGGHVMTVFPPVRIEVDVRTLVQGVTIADEPAGHARYWTDVTIPLGDEGARVHAARRVAELTNGRLHERKGGELNV